MIILSLFLYLNSVKLGLSVVVVVVLIDDDFVVMAFAVVYSFSLFLLGGSGGVEGLEGVGGLSYINYIILSYIYIYIHIYIYGYTSYNASNCLKLFQSLLP